MKIKPLIIIVCIVVILVFSNYIVNFLYYRVNQDYFFFQDPDFLNDSQALAKKWMEYISRGQSGSFANITDGVAWLKIVEKTGLNWSSAVVLQGRMEGTWAKWGQILGGRNEATAKPVEGVTFHRDFPIPSDTFFLKAKVKLIERIYETNVSESVKGKPKGHIGIALMCSFEYKDSEGETRRSNYQSSDTTKPRAVHIDIYFSSFYWNGTTFLHRTYKNLFSGIHDQDFHIGITVPNQLTQLGEWREFTVDLADIFSTTFNLIRKHGWGEEKNIITITVRGIQVYVDGVGVTVQGQYDYVKTTLK